MSVDAFLVFLPQDIMIWFYPRVVKSPKDGSCCVNPTTTPAIDDSPVVVQAQMIIIHNRSGGRADRGGSNDRLVEWSCLGVSEPR